LEAVAAIHSGVKAALATQTYATPKNSKGIAVDDALAQF